VEIGEIMDFGIRLKKWGIDETFYFERNKGNSFCD